MVLSYSTRATASQGSKSLAVTHPPFFFLASFCSHNLGAVCFLHLQVWVFAEIILCKQTHNLDK